MLAGLLGLKTIDQTVWRIFGRVSTHFASTGMLIESAGLMMPTLTTKVTVISKHPTVEKIRKVILEVILNQYK
jgi:hypothetical protein